MSKLKSTLEQLTPKEREALASIYDNEKGFKAFKKLCELEIIELGKDALQATNMEQKEIFHGKAMMAQRLPKLIIDEWKRQNG